MSGSSMYPSIVWWFEWLVISEILIGQGCTNNRPSDQCKDSKSQCTLKSGSYKCACTTDYYANAGICIQSK